MKVKGLLLTAAALATFGSAASAATIYATHVVVTKPGVGIIDTVKDNTSRSDLDNALGAPDGTFFSLGSGENAIFSFGQEFRSPGSVIEITFGTRASHPEQVKIFGAKSLLGSWTELADVSNSVGTNVFTFAGSYNFLKIQDTGPTGGAFDGFDIDAVGVSPVPLPAAGLLLGGALLGLGARKLRRKKA